MAIHKKPEEIEKLKRGGAILSRILNHALAACRPGTRTDELERMVREEMEKAGGRPSFLGYTIHPDDTPYPSALCVSINDEVVHGPSLPPRTFQEGDVAGLDVGMWYEGLATDMAATAGVGQVSEKNLDLIRHTREALMRGLQAVRVGAQVADIGAAIEDYLKPKGYGIVRDLVGHGVGHAVHEEPQIPNYRDPRAPKFRLEEGMVLAIEPMITLGGWQVEQKDDGWTIVTKDGSTAAHFEVTVAVTKTGYELITPWADVETRFIAFNGK